MSHDFTKDLDDLKEFIKEEFTHVNRRIESLERHVTGGSEPERSLLVRLRDTEKDVVVLKKAHTKVNNVLVATGFAALVSVGGAVKSVLTSFTSVR